MSYSELDARNQLLSELARAAGLIAQARDTFGEAYEWLDEHTAERLESELFRPVGAAFGRAQRTLRDFSARHRLAAPQPEPFAPSGRPGDARGAIERAVTALQEAQGTLITLQDSMLPVEVGDPELRAGLAAVRELLSPLPERARQLLRVLGR